MALIDHTQLLSLQELAAGDDTFLPSVIDAFLEQLGSIPGALREAVAGAEAETAAELAHSLKGSAANVGAEDVSGLSRTVEHLARAGDLGEAARLLDELDSVAADTERAFAAAKAQLG